MKIQRGLFRVGVVLSVFAGVALAIVGSSGIGGAARQLEQAEDRLNEASAMQYVADAFVRLRAGSVPAIGPPHGSMPAVESLLDEESLSKEAIAILNKLGESVDWSELPPHQRTIDVLCVLSGKDREFTDQVQQLVGDHEFQGATPNERDQVLVELLSGVSDLSQPAIDLVVGNAIGEVPDIAALELDVTASASRLSGLYFDALVLPLLVSSLLFGMWTGCLYVGAWVISGFRE